MSDDTENRPPPRASPGGEQETYDAWQRRPEPVVEPRACRMRRVVTTGLSVSASIATLDTAIETGSLHRWWSRYATGWVESRFFVVVVAWLIVALITTSIVSRRDRVAPSWTKPLVVATAVACTATLAACNLPQMPFSTSLPVLVSGVGIAAVWISVRSAQHAADRKIPLHRGRDDALTGVVTALNSRFAKPNRRKLRATRVVGALLIGTSVIASTLVVTAGVDGVAALVHIEANKSDGKHGLGQSGLATSTSSGTGTTTTTKRSTGTTRTSIRCLKAPFGTDVYVPEDIAQQIHRAGERARTRYKACPLAHVETLGAGVWVQRAYTKDSVLARVVAWYDHAGTAHATFVTSDQANGYIKSSPSLDWEELGFPLDAMPCDGAAVQPFIDRNGYLVAVGVQRAPDVLGTPQEAVLVRNVMLREWIRRSQQGGAIGIPASREVEEAGEVRQWFLNWADPVVAGPRSDGLPLETLGLLCRSA